MFGHDHDDKKDDNNTQPMSTQPISHGLLGIDDDNDTAASASPAPEPSSSPLPEPTLSTSSFAGNTAAASPNSNVDNKPAETPSLSPVASITSPAIVAPSEPTTAASDDDLVDIKRQALQELSPLIDHLDQNAEEKFKTSMMMIQASDDKDLIPQAFKAAKDITDEKKRAQALLDIVNEINYFTHKSDD